MYNPYFHEPIKMLERKTDGGFSAPLHSITNRIQQLDSDDLLLLLLIFLLFRDGERDYLWPLLAVLVYCML